MNAKSKIRDIQDTIELHLFQFVEYDKSLMFVTVNGTGTIDSKIPVINTGYSFNMPSQTEAEVLLLANGSSVNDKIALMLIPRDKQKQWRPRTGGIQSPETAEQVVEFNPLRTQIRGDRVALGNKGQIEIDGSTIILRGNVVIEGSVSIQGSLEVVGDVHANGTGSFSQASATRMNAISYEYSPNVVTVPVQRHPFKDYEE